MEPAITIGTRAIIRKFGCFYWSFKSLPPWLNENSRLTHVAVITASLDLKTYGFDPFWLEISRDIKPLEVCESFKTSSDREVPVKGSKLTFVAGNLAITVSLALQRNSRLVFVPKFVLRNKRTSKVIAEKLHSHSGTQTTVPKSQQMWFTEKIVIGLKRSCLLRTKKIPEQKKQCSLNWKALVAFTLLIQFSNISLVPLSWNLIYWYFNVWCARWFFKISP